MTRIQRITLAAGTAALLLSATLVYDTDYLTAPASSAQTRRIVHQEVAPVASNAAAVLAAAAQPSTSRSWLAERSRAVAAAATRTGQHLHHKRLGSGADTVIDRLRLTAAAFTRLAEAAAGSEQRRRDARSQARAATAALLASLAAVAA